MFFAKTGQRYWDNFNIILTISVRKQTLFLTITTAVISLSIISNLSIMSSSVVCIFALLYVHITNNEYLNPSVTL